MEQQVLEGPAVNCEVEQSSFNEITKRLLSGRVLLMEDNVPLDAFGRSSVRHAALKGPAMPLTGDARPLAEHGRRQAGEASRFKWRATRCCSGL